MTRDIEKELWIFNKLQTFSDRHMFSDDDDIQGQKRKSQGGELLDYGWNIHHVLPTSDGGSDDESNLEIEHWIINSDAADKTVFATNGQRFRVKKSNNGWYGIFRDSDDQRVDDTVQRQEKNALQDT